MEYILIYVVIMNMIGIYIMAYDKKKARKKKWRTKERTFFFIALLGGAHGILIGSKRYRHKTKHASFIYGIPLIILLQVIVICFLLYYFQDSLSFRFIDAESDM